MTPEPSSTEVLKLTRFALGKKITLLILTAMLDIPKRDWERLTYL